MRHLVIGLGVLVSLASVAPVAAAQQYKQIEFQEFLANEKKWHGKLIAMHAQFISDEQRYSNGSFDAKYFEGNGVNDKKYYRFSVEWRAQTREWLYPVIERKGSGASMWDAVKGLKKGDKLTLYGKVKRLGDTGGRGAPQNPYSQGGGGSGYYSEVPSIIEIAQVKLGWVKTLTEYVQDLGDEGLVEETIVMLTREGPGVMPTLLKVADSTQFSETQRANACAAIAAFGIKSFAGRMASLVKDTDVERIRSAAIVAMGKLDPEEAVKTVIKLFEQREPDPWAPYALAELVSAKLVEAPALEGAFGDTWDQRRPTVVAACLDIAETAHGRKQYARAEQFCTMAIGLDPAHGAAYHWRGKARQAQLEQRPELAQLIAQDFQKAVELGEEDPDLFLAHARALLKTGDKAKAARYAELVLAERKDDPEARKIKAAAEGKSVDMIDSRVVRMNGATLRMPAKTEDLTDYVDRKRGEVMRARWFPEGKQQGKPVIEVLMLQQDDPSAKAGPHDLGAPAGIDPESAAKQIAQNNGGTILEAGRDTLDGGRTLGWCVSEKKVSDGTLKYLWGVVPSNGKYLTLVYIVGDPKVFDAHRVTVEESIRSATWEGEQAK